MNMTIFKNDSALAPYHTASNTPPKLNKCLLYSTTGSLKRSS